MRKLPQHIYCYRYAYTLLFLFWAHYSTGVAATASSPDSSRYIVFNLQAWESDGSKWEDVIYLTAYQYTAGGGRILMRRSRYPKGGLSLSLDRNFRYDLELSIFGYADTTLTVDCKNLFILNNQINHNLTFDRPVEVIPKAPAFAATSEGAAATTPRYPAGLPAIQASRKVKLDSYFVIKRTSLRAKPDAQAEILMRLPVDTEVRFLEKTDGWWWKVSCNNIVGYAKARYLTRH
jgi:hypothetical protein